MEIRFLVGQGREVHEVPLPEGAPVPRVGDEVVLRVPDTADVYRCAVKSVTWDFTSARPTVEIRVGAAAPARVPSFAAYTD